MINSKPQETTLKAVNSLVDFVKPTYGPASNKVIIHKDLYKLILDDGVMIAREFSSDKVDEQSIINIVREVAIKTNEREGDGTTGSLILIQAILNNCYRRQLLSKKLTLVNNSRSIEQELLQGRDEALEQLTQLTQSVDTLEDLEKVARISFDDDVISKLIAETWFDMGKDAVISLDASPTADTYVEMSNGIKIDAGSISPYLPKSLKSPKLFITDYTLAFTEHVEPIIRCLLKEANSRDIVFIVDNIEGEALDYLVTNAQKGAYNMMIIKLPRDFDGEREELLQDLELLTDATVFTHGKKPMEIKAEDFGDCGKFEATQEYSTIIDPKPNKDKLEAKIQEYKEEDNTKRLAFLTNKIATIKVGGNTENEQKALRFKIEDAVNAVRSAYINGVVPGGGSALQSIKTSSPILNKALKQPYKELCINSCVKPQYLDKWEAHNVVKGEVGNAFDVGVIDPVNVLKAALESAVSIAGLLITTKGIIVEDKKVDK